MITALAVATVFVFTACPDDKQGTAPAITTASLPDGTVGTAYTWVLEATGDTLITWSLDSGVFPAGINLFGNGVISGTPTAAGTFPFTVKATNAAGNDTKQLSITITGGAPIITTATLPNGVAGTAYSQKLAATGVTPVTWSLSGTLPAGLSLVEATGVISGTPTAVGTSTFTVTATNSVGEDTKQLSITIISVAIITTSLPNGVVGTAYNQTLAATGATPITWSLEEGGALPAGLSLAATGTITGTPTAVGTSTFTVKAANAAGSDTKQLSITITGVAPPAFIEMVQIQPGTFTMGSPENEEGHFQEGEYGNIFTDETQHSVTLTGFRMGKYQVTQAQYREVMGTNPSAHCSGGTRAQYVTGLDTENFPVERVSWYDALVFCNKLSMDEGLTPAYRINGSTDPAAWGIVPESGNETWNAVEIVAGSTGYRLPTEAQWEYACRAGTWGDNYSVFNTGNNITTSQANYDGNFPYNNNPKGIYLARTKEVGSFAPNAYVLYDMHGNVFEWCWDWYGIYASGTQTDPTGVGIGLYRMLRGGSWNHDGEQLRSAYRDYQTPHSRSYYFGFRVVLPAQ